MSVEARVDLVNIHGQAFAVTIPSLKVCNLDLIRRGRPFDDVSAAVADTWQLSVSHFAPSVSEMRQVERTALTSVLPRSRSSRRTSF